jgi:hypothetical protein
MKTKNVSWLASVVFLTLPLYAVDTSVPSASGVTPGAAAQVSSAPTLTPPTLSPNAAEVLKLSGAGVGDEVILAYVKNCQGPFSLSAEAILRLKEAEISSPVIVAMLTHDGWLRNQNAGSPQPQPVAPDVVPPGQTPPPAPEEVVPVAPGPDYYWAPGYWGWNGGWVWIGGSWCFRGGYGWGGHYGRGWYGHGGWGGYHGGVGGFHGVGGGVHGGGGFHGGGGGFHGGGGGHGGGHGR